MEDLAAEVKWEFQAKKVQKKIGDSQLRKSRTQFLLTLLSMFKDTGVAMKPSSISDLKQAQTCLKRKLDVEHRNLWPADVYNTPSAMK